MSDLYTSYNTINGVSPNGFTTQLFGTTGDSAIYKIIRWFLLLVVVIIFFWLLISLFNSKKYKKATGSKGGWSGVPVTYGKFF